MIDHLVQFPDEATAQADKVVGAYWMPPTTRGTEIFNGAWRGDVCFPTQVYTVTGQETVTRTLPDGTTVDVVQDVRAYSTDFYLWIATAQPDADLEASPACILIRDRDAPEQFITKSAISLSDLPAMCIEPVILSSAYPYTPDDWAAVDPATIATAQVVAADVTAEPMLTAVAMPVGTLLKSVSVGGKVIKGVGIMA